MEAFAMANIRTHRGNLFFDFRFQGMRCREYTSLPDTPTNRRKLQPVADKIAAEITLGTFNYASYLPNSKRAQMFEAPGATVQGSAASASNYSPLYKEFVETWFSENEVLWRNSHTGTVRSTLNRHLLPNFGDTPVAEITKEQTLRVRSKIARLKGRGNKTLAPKTVNRIFQIHGQIMAEAAERYEFTDPTERIKRIPQPRVNINPLSLEEAQLVINNVRSDYRDYMIVRLFTGLRTGELHGLQWKYVDFDKRQLLIRETI